MLKKMREFKAGIFQALSHPTRVEIVEHLSKGELSVRQLCEKAGIEQTNASQHLAILRHKQIVETRKVGNQIFYKLRDPLFAELLARMRQYFFAHVNEAVELLRAERQAAKKAGREKQEAKR